MFSGYTLSLYTDVLESIKLEGVFGVYDDADLGETTLPLDVEPGESGEASSLRRNGKDEIGERDRNNDLLQEYAGTRYSNAG